MNTPLSRFDAAEQLLVDGCRAGEKIALETIFRRHGSHVERLIRTVIGPSPDVEDLLQTTFIAAFRAFPGYRGDSSVRGWLGGIAVHVARDHLRRPDRRRLVPLESLPPEREPAGEDPGADRLADGRIQLRRLYEHLDRVDADKRIAFVLHIIEGHPIEEVAKMVNATRAATKSRIFWARRNLLARIKRDPALRDFLLERAGPTAGIDGTPTDKEAMA